MQKNKEYEPTLQDKEDIKELKKDKEDLERSKAKFKVMQAELLQMIQEDKDEQDNSKSKPRITLDMFTVNNHFTIVNKEVIDPESHDLGSDMLPKTIYYPGTNWKWNQFDMKRLMMKDVKEQVEKAIEESTTKYSKEMRKRQDKLVKRLFKKRIVKFDITPNMSEKKKKLTRIANAILDAARKMKEANITLDEIISGEKTLL